MKHVGKLKRRRASEQNFPWRAKFDDCAFREGAGIGARFAAASHLHGNAHGSSFREKTRQAGYRAGTLRSPRRCCRLLPQRSPPALRLDLRRKNAAGLPSSRLGRAWGAESPRLREDWCKKRTNAANERSSTLAGAFSVS